MVTIDEKKKKSHERDFPSVGLHAFQFKKGNNNIMNVYIYLRSK